MNYLTTRSNTVDIYYDFTKEYIYTPLNDETFLTAFAIEYFGSSYKLCRSN